MDEQPDKQDKKTKDRSPNFPFISLSAAVDRAKAFYDEERKGAAPVTRAGIHWKYSPNSSGLIQTVAALKSYGLMVDEGSGTDRRLRLTELALRIVLDTRPDSPERAEMLRRAALSPNVCSEVHANWPDGLPSDETLHHCLVLERSFAPPNALRAVKILKENQQFAKLSHGVGLSADTTAVSDSESNKHDDMMESHVVTSSAPVDGNNYRTQAQRNVVVSARMRAPTLPFTEQVLDPDGNTVRLEFAVQPTEEMYEFLKDYIELRLKAMKRRSSAQITGHAPTVTVAPSQPPETSSGPTRVSDVDLP